MDDYNFYHILNRGVEKRNIFLDKEYYSRFVNNLFGLNNKYQVASYGCRTSATSVIPATKLVEIICWCLMPNHFHIFVSEKEKGMVSLFSKKTTEGYTKFFNKKNNRSGVLFQGKSKIIPLEKNEHFLWLPFYIMSNPIKLIEPNWKEYGIKNIKKAVEFLENYKYSSLRDLIGKSNFPDTQNKNLFYEIYDTNEKKFKKDFIEWLSGDFR